MKSLGKKEELIIFNGSVVINGVYSLDVRVFLVGIKMDLI